MLNKGSFFANNREMKDAAQPMGGRVITTSSPLSTSSANNGGSPMSAVSQPPEPAPATEPPGAKLVVGPGVKLKGAEIQNCDTLLVEGRVEATMDSRLIEIAAQGSFDGKVTVNVAEIRGHFNGELTARERLIIHSTGSVSGTIRYGKIVVLEDGEVSGDIRSLNTPELFAKPKSPGPVMPEEAKAANIAAVNQLLAKAG